MDKKQLKVFESILEKYKLSMNAKLIQFRNLKEFKYFEIERINPNHIIELYGKLKNSDEKRNVCHRIHVGRIIIPYIMILELSSILFSDIVLVFSCMTIALSILYINDSISTKRFIYDCINRRWARFRENSISSSIC